MALLSYRLRAKVWIHDGAAAWHFLTLPRKQAREIRMLVGGATGRGWGSVPVVVTAGGTTWRTSIFPDKKAGSFVLPLKAEVRVAEGIRAGDTVEFLLEVQ